MAITKVNKQCMRCYEDLESGDEAVYINVVELTDKGYGYPWTGRSEPKEHQLRIRHKPNKNPKGVMHTSCFKDMMTNES